MHPSSIVTNCTDEFKIRFCRKSVMVFTANYSTLILHILVKLALQWLIADQFIINVEYFSIEHGKKYHQSPQQKTKTGQSYKKNSELNRFRLHLYCALKISVWTINIVAESALLCGRQVIQTALTLAYK